MKSFVFLMTFCVFCETCDGVRCYKCEPVWSESAERRFPLCQHFDGDDRFVIECAASTMCLKKETSLYIGDTVTTIVTRGCAPQILPGYQEKRDRKWWLVKKIHEVYDETCEEGNEEERVTKTVTCYCRGELCNGSRRASEAAALLVGATLAWLLAS